MLDKFTWLVYDGLKIEAGRTGRVPGIVETIMDTLIQVQRLAGYGYVTVLRTANDNPDATMRLAQCEASRVPATHMVRVRKYTAMGIRTLYTIRGTAIPTA